MMVDCEMRNEMVYDCEILMMVDCEMVVEVRDGEMVNDI